MQSEVRRVTWSPPNVLAIVVQWSTVMVGVDVPICSSLNSRGVYHITRGVSGSVGHSLCSCNDRNRVTPFIVECYSLTVVVLRVEVGSGK